MRRYVSICVRLHVTRTRCFELVMTSDELVLVEPTSMRPRPTAQPGIATDQQSSSDTEEFMGAWSSGV